MQETKTTQSRLRAREFGTLDTGVPDALFSPLPEEELTAWE
ncbi:hypothetical protein Slu03_20940 [Sediminihabitans luteus]|nr:hypothetical protein [Sediminihabitans luteus]GII99716.1 hypothetical protein Slu03_20940 [Sediminihabitans luteus]